MLVLFTDTDTDLTPEEAKEFGYKMISMPYIVNHEIIKPYEDFEVFDSKKFYDSLRDGLLPKTCALNPEAYRDYFEPEFEKGNDILYVHFSRAMSGSFDAMDAVVKELLEKYPGRKFYTIDTKGITIGSLNMVKEIGDLYKSGAAVDEILEWGKKEVDHFATYFFADNLKFFKRSGRISNIAATMGSLIGIKPIIYMDDKGMMTNITKERGRINALKRLVAYVEELALDIDKHRVIVGHSDSLELANMLAEMLVEKFGPLRIEYAVVNPTAGSHCGPDTVGVSFHAIHK